MCCCLGEGLGQHETQDAKCPGPGSRWGLLFYLPRCAYPGREPSKGSVTARSREGLTSSLPVGASSFSPSEGAIGPERGPKETLWGRTCFHGVGPVSGLPLCRFDNPTCRPGSGIYGATKAKPSVSSPGPTALLSELRSIRIVGKLLTSRRFSPHRKTLT